MVLEIINKYWNKNLSESVPKKILFYTENGKDQIHELLEIASKGYSVIQDNGHKTVFKAALPKIPPTVILTINGEEDIQVQIT